MNQRAINEFQTLMQEHYYAHGRHSLPWRSPEPDGSFNPYKIFVSEVMLQQTPVPRVLPQYTAFLRVFSSIASLAAAPLKDVLIAWQGLGYNRRAKFLWQASRQLMCAYGGAFPRGREQLMQLPGVGQSTAGAVLAYAYNEPVIFIETNIRTVFMHHFFPGQTGIPDSAILPLLVATLDRGMPRVWYWMLMDYGTYLKQTVSNTACSSAGYVKQPKFQGSKRQVRGQALRLLSSGPLSRRALLQRLADVRAVEVLRDLQAEGLIRRQAAHYELL